MICKTVFFSSLSVILDLVVLDMKCVIFSIVAEWEVWKIQIAMSLFGGKFINFDPQPHKREFLAKNASFRSCSKIFRSSTWTGTTLYLFCQFHCISRMLHAMLRLNGELRSFDILIRIFFAGCQDYPTVGNRWTLHFLSTCLLKFISVSVAVSVSPDLSLLSATMICIH